MNLSNDTPHFVAFETLGWNTLKVERTKAERKMMFKLLNHKGPISLTNLFTHKETTITYNLRNIPGSLSLPLPRTNSMKKSFMYDGASNSIPRHIKESKSVSPFNLKIAAHFNS